MRMPTGERLEIARCAPKAVRTPPPSNEIQLPAVARRERSWSDHFSRDSFMSRLVSMDSWLRCVAIAESFVQEARSESACATEFLGRAADGLVSNGIAASRS